MTKSAWEDDWQRAARERDDLVAERDALATELAASEKQGTAAHDACVQYEARVAALEAALVKAVALCKTCDGKGGWKGSDDGEIPYATCIDCSPIRRILSSQSETK